MSVCSQEAEDQGQTVEAEAQAPSSQEAEDQGQTVEAEAEEVQLEDAGSEEAEAKSGDLLIWSKEMRARITAADVEHRRGRTEELGKLEGAEDGREGGRWTAPSSGNSKKPRTGARTSWRTGGRRAAPSSGRREC